MAVPLLPVWFWEAFAHWNSHHLSSRYSHRMVGFPKLHLPYFRSTSAFLFSPTKPGLSCCTLWTAGVLTKFAVGETGDEPTRVLLLWETTETGVQDLGFIRYKAHGWGVGV